MAISSRSGPDNCLYATQSDRIIKLTRADGTCGFVSPKGAPQLALSPLSISSAQGTTATFTASLRNVPNPSGIPITLNIRGANASLHLENTNAAGEAVFTYTAWWRASIS